MRAFASVLFLLHAGAASPVAAQEPQPQVAPQSADTTPRDSARRSRPRPVRRQALTPELERSAFADPTARLLLSRARAARLAQDSALQAYDAKTYLRFSVGMSVRGVGPDRLLMRTEQSARVQWARGSGLWVEPTGRRTAFPMGEAQLDLSAATPIPYFPGRESLWMPSGEMGVAKAEVNENDLLHPLATGAEAYYRYATGDSVSIRLPDGRKIGLRELRITARRPDWHAFVGSFWFDVERGSLVRAGYRLAAEIDLWQKAGEDQRRKIEQLQERARTDTGAAALDARREAEATRPSMTDKLLLSLLQGTLRPMRANVSAITVEYALYDGRFWLPKLNSAEAEIRAGFMRLPMKWEESFRYNDVNGSAPVPVVPALAQMDDAADDTTSWRVEGQVIIGGRARQPSDTSAAARVATEDSLVREFTKRADSLRTAAGRARARGEIASARQLTERAARYAADARLIVRRRAECAHDSTYFAGTVSRYDDALRMAIRMPCDRTRLANSPDLPGSIYEPHDEIFGTTERDELLKVLDLSLQPGWGPQKPVLLTGLSFMRYNRIEGLSLGGSATSVLGLGYTAQAVARIGTGDWVPNGELSLTRTNGRADLRLGVFHRLGVANDDWGAPLSFGASLANLLYARDEGFYYRAWGVEVSGTRDASPPLGGATARWALFADRQRSAGREPNTQASLGNLVGDARFRRNIDAVPLTAVGAGGELARTFGVVPTALRLATRARAEGAFTHRSDSIGASGYGRLVLDGTLARGFGPIAAALTGAAGVAVGELPPQRAFYVGGLHTVRGQFARPEGAGHVGDAFWLARSEVGLSRLAVVRPALFYDIGWAGSRDDFTTPGRPLSGAGVGLSLLDGLLRIDVSRGIWPEKRWRTDLYLNTRF